jgi:ubiquitin conjugation factor E4 B
MGHRLEHIGGVRAELEEQGAPLKLNTGLLDQAILEAASAQQKQTPMDYLLSCWKRVSAEYRKVRTKSDTARIEVVKEAKRLCMSYCIFAITIPDMFGQEAPATSPLVQHLLVNQEDDRGLCHDFLVEISSRFEDDESAKDAIVTAVEEMSKQLAGISMNGDFKPYILVSQGSSTLRWRCTSEQA